MISTKFLFICFFFFSLVYRHPPPKSTHFHGLNRSNHAMTANHSCDHLPAALDVDFLRGWQLCSGDVLGSLDHPLERSPVEGGAAPGGDVLTP